ncbi:hypothetical protein [Nocardioides sp. T2.26MG-1]|uniref:hypothetical protein n=1 Tax=Nocardioides sp. T2.26MG-1 TaxID=3041166 RepID=UPI002477B7C7|nr:hypothetical protein [Nocardioides sp. T2.26MG-1]CAI9417368.1 hypothetical protein HIDPHFAB_03002 [Nocardioides sp. T2.26MG-1]
MPAISRRLLLVSLATRLQSVTNATGYVGQIGAKNGLDPTVAAPADPPTKSATDLRVKPYFILEPGIGAPLAGEASAGGPVDAFRDDDAPWTVRAAAGDVSDLLALVDRIDAALNGWTPDPGVAGVIAGPLVPQPGYRPPLLSDNGVAPPRFFTPLQYRLIAHT